MSKDTASGSGNTSSGEAATAVANPPSTGIAATRSPAVKPEPSGASRTVPATSLPSRKGRSGFIWYSPRDSSRSGKTTPAASTSMSTWPSPTVGSSTSATSTASGPSSRTTCTARTATSRSGRPDRQP